MTVGLEIDAVYYLAEHRVALPTDKRTGVTVETGWHFQSLCWVSDVHSV